jgi:hypothetical protein
MAVPPLETDRLMAALVRRKEINPVKQGPVPYPRGSASPTSKNRMARQ